MRTIIVLGIGLWLVAVNSAVIRAEVVTIDGTVKSVDAKKRTITVETGSKTLTLDVSSKAKISVDAKDAGPESLTVGQKVRLSYHKDLEVVLKIESSSNEATNGETSSLFDGKTLAGWKPLDGGEVKGWTAKNGVLTATPGSGTTPLLLTNDTFDDFEFRCDFWLDRKTNSGVLLRGRYEVQLMDDPSNPNAEPIHRCGAIYDRVAPTKFVYHGPRQWNSLLVRLQRKTASVVLNGTTVIDRRYVGNVSRIAVDDLEDQPGPIALQGQGRTPARFRNLTIRRLTR